MAGTSGAGKEEHVQWAHKRRRPYSMASKADRHTRDHTGGDRVGEGGSKSQREARVRGEGDRAGAICDRTAKAMGQSQKEWQRAVVRGGAVREHGQDQG